MSSHGSSIKSNNLLYFSAGISSLMVFLPSNKILTSRLAGLLNEVDFKIDVSQEIPVVHK